MGLGICLYWLIPNLIRLDLKKTLVEPLNSSYGIDNYGHRTGRNRHKGHKRLYRVIDWKRNKLGIPAKVATIEYDPNRTANIALLHYVDGEKRYILAPNGLKKRRYGFSWWISRY